MIYSGSFTEKTGRVCSVEIETKGDRGETREIGANGLYFDAEEPLMLTLEGEDLFEVLLRQNGTLRMQSDRFIPDLFQPDCMDSKVTVYEDGETIFKGFLYPRVYSQEFNSVCDSLDLTLIDRLTALQWRYWRNCGSFGVDYDRQKAECQMMSLRDILGVCFQAVGITWEEVKFRSVPTVSGGASALDGVMIDESLFMGGTEEDVWTLEDVLKECLQYLNLHIADFGNEVTVFDWEDIKTNEPEVRISSDNAYGTQTRIEIGDIYNRIRVACETQGEIETVLDDPLDTEGCTSPYAKTHHYLRQYNFNMPATEADYINFGKLLAGQDFPGVQSSEVWVRDYWVRPLKNAGWKFYGYDADNTPWDCRMPIPSTDGRAEVCSDDEEKGINEWKAPENIKNLNGAGLLEIKTTRQEFRPENHTPGDSADTERVLVIHVGGKWNTNDEREGPTVSIDAPAFRDPVLSNWYKWDNSYAEEFRLKCMKSAPRAVWTGGTVKLSPDDSETTRYLDISGKITLVPTERDSEKWSNIEDYIRTHSLFDTDTFKKLVTLCGAKRKEGNDVINTVAFMHRFFRDTEPCPDVNGHFPYGGDSPGFQFFQEGETWKKEIVPGTLDTTGKLGVLICALIIGDKCLCEWGDTESGDASNYSWQPIENGRVQTFALGFDVKPGDYLLGKEYPIAKNLPNTKLLDLKGTAIPIRKSDNLHGEMKFYIIGPAFMRFDSTKVRNTLHYLGEGECIPPGDGGHIMRGVESIWLKDFSINVVSDNAGLDPLQENDIIYTSDTDDRYRNEKEDIPFRISSALTVDEREELGVRDVVMKSTATHEGGKGVTEMNFRGRRIKPEIYFVDSYFNEYSKPKVALMQDFRNLIINPFECVYRHPALENPMFPTGFSRNIGEGVVSLNLREIK